MWISAQSPLSDPFRVSACARSNSRIRCSFRSTPRPIATCAVGRSCRAPLWWPPRTASPDSQSPPAQCTRVVSTRIAAQHRVLWWYAPSFLDILVLLVESVNYCMRLSFSLCSLLQATIWIHPQYSSTTMYNDLAIVTLASPFTLNSNVATLPLAASTATFNTGILCTVSGWGDTVFGRALTVDAASVVLLMFIVGCCRRFDFQHTAVRIGVDCEPVDMFGVLDIAALDSHLHVHNNDRHMSRRQRRSGNLQRHCARWQHHKRSRRRVHSMLSTRPTKFERHGHVSAGIVSYGNGCSSGIPGVNTRVSSYSGFIFNYISGSSTLSTRQVSGITATVTQIDIYIL